MYRKAILLIFGILVAASAIYALMDHKKYTTSSDEAYKAFLKGEELRTKLYVNEALGEFERALQLDPQFAMAMMRVGAFKVALQNDRVSYEELKARVMPLLDKVKEIERLLILATFAELDDRPDDYERYYKELTEKYPNDIATMEIQGHRYFNRLQLEESRDTFLKILELDPTYILSYNMLGYIHYALEDYDKSLEYIRKYSELAPDQANPHDSYGEILLRLGRYDEALEQFHKADSVKFNLQFVVQHIGDAYCAKGMFREGLGAYYKALELTESKYVKADIYRKIADCYRYSDRIDEAIKILEETASGTQDYLGTQGHLGFYYAEAGRLDDALIQLGIVKSIAARRIADSQHSDTTSGEEPPIMLIALESKIAERKGNFDDAIAGFNSIMDRIKFPSKYEAARLLCEIYQNAGRHNDVISLANEMLKHNPNSALMLALLADSYEAKGMKQQQKETLQHFAEVVKDADDNIPLVNRMLAKLEKLDRRIS